MSGDVESRFASLCRSGALDAAATEALETYGAEVLGWLIATTHNRAEAEDAFSAAAEDFWRSLPSFQNQCSLRTWLYALTRNALSRQRQTAAHRPHRREPLSRAQEIAAEVRSRTSPWLRTDVKQRFAALRDELDEDDRSLLVLRIDRDLSWEEIALVIDGESENPARVAARLRKRFQLIKDRLRERARELGLLDSES